MIRIESLLPDMLLQLKRLVDNESPSHNKRAVDTVGTILMEYVKSMGAEIEIIKNDTTGDHIIAKFTHQQSSGKSWSERGILLLCHMDTVHPTGTINEMPFQEKDGRILGPGVADMKSGIVIGLNSIRFLQENKMMPMYPINLLITSDEETGSHTSSKLIEEMASVSRLVLVLEPGMPDGAIKTWRKGTGEFHILVHGKAAHAGGAHEKGCNAIEELAHQVLAIQSLTDYERGTTLNVGVCQGGSVVNVVPENAWMDVDVRIIQPGEAERITSMIHNLKPILNGTSLEITGSFDRPPMPYNELMRTTYEHAKEIAESEGIHLSASGTGGASDGNLVAPLGIPLLDGLGAIGGDYHSKNEYILKESLISRSKLVTALLQKWDQVPS